MASHEKDKAKQHGSGEHSGKPSDMNKQQEQQAGKTSQAGGSEKTRHMEENEKGKSGGHTQRR